MTWPTANRPSTPNKSALPTTQPVSPSNDLTRADTIVANDHHDGNKFHSHPNLEGDEATLSSPRRNHKDSGETRRKSSQKEEHNHFTSSTAANGGRSGQYRKSTARAHFVAVTGEFLGTFFFLWCSLAGTSYAVNVSNDSTNTSSVTANYYASVVFGLSLLANVWVFYRVSGGLFNPAVTLGLVVSGKLPVIRGILYFPTQIFAGMAASGLVKCMFPGPLSGVTKLSLGTSTAQGFWIEAFLTAMLTKAVLILAGEKHKGTFLAPVGIGLAFFSAELVGIPYTGGSLNPARSFGPDVANLSFEGYHWIYWIGPLVGALAASGYDRLARFLRYHEANPGQDAAHPDEVA